MVQSSFIGLLHCFFVQKTNKPYVSLATDVGFEFNVSLSKQTKLMKKSMLLSTMLFLCCLFSCQRTPEDVRPIPVNSAGRVAASTSTLGDDWLAEGYTEQAEFSQVPSNVQGVCNNYFSRVSWLEANANFHDDQTMLN